MIPPDIWVAPPPLNRSIATTSAPRDRPSNAAHTPAAPYPTTTTSGHCFPPIAAPVIVHQSRSELSRCARLVARDDVQTDVVAGPVGNCCTGPAPTRTCSNSGATHRSGWVANHDVLRGGDF